MLDIYARLLNAGVSMRDIDNMDLVLYFQVLAREMERRDKDRQENGEDTGRPMDWNRLKRTSIDQIPGFR